MVRVQCQASSQEIESLWQFTAQTLLASLYKVKISILSFPNRCLRYWNNSESDSYWIERNLKHFCVVFVNVSPFLVKSAMHNPVRYNGVVILTLFIKIGIELFYRLIFYLSRLSLQSSMML